MFNCIRVQLSVQIYKNIAFLYQRCAHKTTYDPSTEKIWLFGGKGATTRLADTFSFDLKSLSWTYHSENTSKITPRSFHEITNDNGKIYVHGGRDDFNKHLGDIVQIHPEFKQIESDVKIGNHMVFSIKNSKCYVYGGSSDFNPDYGCCDKFYDDLHIGTIQNDNKKAKFEESPTKKVREDLESSKIEA